MHEAPYIIQSDWLKSRFWEHYFFTTIKSSGREEKNGCTKTNRAQLSANNTYRYHSFYFYKILDGYTKRTMIFFNFKEKILVQQI